MVVYNRDKKELTIPIGWGAIEDIQRDYSTLPMGAVILSGNGYFYVDKTLGPQPAVEDISFYYSKNGSGWIEIDNTHPDNKIPVTKGDIITFMGYNEYYGNNEQNGTSIIFSGVTWELKGNIMSLCYGEDFSGITVHNHSGICPRLFFGNDGLISAKNLVLPLLEVPAYAFGFMFSTCPALKEAPYLPATKIGFHSYYGLFMYNSITEIHCALDPQYAGAPNTSYWLYGTPDTGTFYGKDVENWPTGNDGIPEGWERVEID